MSELEQTYNADRARNLEELLRGLARRILELDAEDRLLEQAGELTRLTGNVRSELFHYEVRATYDTPEVARHRRLVSETIRDAQQPWDTSKWAPNADEREQW